MRDNRTIGTPQSEQSAEISSFLQSLGLSEKRMQEEYRKLVRSLSAIQSRHDDVVQTSLDQR